MSIKESMGHAKVDDTVADVNKRANLLFNKRLQDDRKDTEVTFNPLSAMLPSGSI